MADLCGFDILDVLMIVHCRRLLRWKNVSILISLTCENPPKTREHFRALSIIIFDRNDILILKAS